MKKPGFQWFQYFDFIQVTEVEVNNIIRTQLLTTWEDPFQNNKTDIKTTVLFDFSPILCFGYINIGISWKLESYFELSTKVIPIIQNVLIMSTIRYNMPRHCDVSSQIILFCSVVNKQWQRVQESMLCGLNGHGHF